MPDPLSTSHEDSLPSGVRITDSHPSLALLRGHREQVLPSEVSTDIGTHLASCSLCRMLLNDLEEFPLPELGPVSKEYIRRSLPLPLGYQQSSWKWYSIAAVALFAAAVFLGTRHRQLFPRFTGRATHSIATASPESTSLQSAVQIAKLAPPLESSPALVLRGGEPSSSDPTAEEMAPAFSAYENNDYRASEIRFQALTKRFPHSVTPVLYLGISQLLSNNFTAALPNLARAESLAHESHSSQQDAAAWYRAFAAFQSHSPDAHALLEAICTRKDNPYSESACRLIDK